MLKRSARLADRWYMPILAILVSAFVILGAPSTASANSGQVTDVFVRSATRAMVATRLGVGDVGVERHLFDLRCRRARTATIRCSWSYGPNGGRLVAYGEGTVSVVAASTRAAPPRYRYDYRVDIGHRVGLGRYRTRHVRWRYTSPDHMGFAKQVARRFQRFADAAVADSPYAGAAQTAGPTCAWSLLDDRTVAASCSADYRGFRDGQPCTLHMGGTWAEGNLTVAALDDSACASPPG